MIIFGKMNIYFQYNFKFKTIQLIKNCCKIPGMLLLENYAFTSRCHYSIKVLLYMSWELTQRPWFLQRLPNFLKQWFSCSKEFPFTFNKFFYVFECGNHIRFECFFTLCHQSQNEIHIWVHDVHWIYLSLFFAEIWICFEAFPFYFGVWKKLKKKQCLC